MSKIFLLNYSNKADILDQLDDGALRRFFYGTAARRKEVFKIYRSRVTCTRFELMSVA